MLAVKNGLRDRVIVLQGTGNSATRSYGTTERQRGLKKNPHGLGISIIMVFYLKLI